MLLVSYTGNHRTLHELTGSFFSREGREVRQDGCVWSVRTYLLPEPLTFQVPLVQYWVSSPSLTLPSLTPCLCRNPGSCRCTVVLDVFTHLPTQWACCHLQPFGQTAIVQHSTVWGSSSKARILHHAHNRRMLTLKSDDCPHTQNTS